MFREIQEQGVGGAEESWPVLGLRDDAYSGGDDMAQWVQREYGKAEIDRCGSGLATWWAGKGAPDGFDIGHSLVVVQNWRASHAMPLLTFRMGLSKRAKRVSDSVIIAQRLKRFSSVMNKLAREPHMKLSQMQDLGGCRAILPSVKAVDDVYGLYRGSDELLFETERAPKYYDYIRNPKTDGYRGVHVVGRYAPRLEKNEPWNGHRIEVQLRTRLQHAFATAVETVTTFTRAPLKFGGGPDEWRRFFALMGSALALREGTSYVDGTPTDSDELTRELREVAKALKARQRLAGWARALRRLPRRNVKKFNMLLLVLNVTDSTIKVTGFTQPKRATDALNQIENMKRGDLDAVLVWVNSIQELKAAYPNYYADTGEFIAALNYALRA